MVEPTGTEIFLAYTVKFLSWALVAGFFAIFIVKDSKKLQTAKKCGIVAAVLTFVFTGFLTLTDKDSTAAIGMITIVPLLSLLAGVTFFWLVYWFVKPPPQGQ